MDKRQWTAEEIKNLLQRNDMMVGRSLERLYRRQTDDEKKLEQTKHENGIGFNAVDASLLTSFAKQWMHTGRLSCKQLFVARKKLPKYVKQLLEEANK